jgi:hypothetical protein
MRNAVQRRAISIAHTGAHGLAVGYTVIGFAYCSALITSMHTNGSLPSTQAS